MFWRKLLDLWSDKIFGLEVITDRFVAALWPGSRVCRIAVWTFEGRLAFDRGDAPERQTADSVPVTVRSWLQHHRVWKGWVRGRSARLRFHYSTPLTKAPQISYSSRFFTERMRERGEAQVRHWTHLMHGDSCKQRSQSAAHGNGLEPESTDSIAARFQSLRHIVNATSTRDFSHLFRLTVASSTWHPRHAIPAPPTLDQEVWLTTRSGRRGLSKSFFLYFYPYQNCTIVKKLKLLLFKIIVSIFLTFWHSHIWIKN